MDRMQRWKKAAKKTLSSQLIGKFPLTLKGIAESTLQLIDTVMPCAIHPAFKDKFADLSTTLGQYHICMVSIDDIRIQACAILSVYATVRARRAALKPKESSHVGCVAPSTLPCEVTRCALARVAILTREIRNDGGTTFYATRFSKFIVVPCEWLLCSVVSNAKSYLDKKGNVNVDLDAGESDVIEKAFGGQYPPCHLATTFVYDYDY